MKDLKAAIFDWNGTLIDDVWIVHQSVIAIFESYGLKPPALKRYRNEIVADFMLFYLKYGIPSGTTKEELNKIRKKVLEERWNEVELHKGAAQTVKELKKIGLKIGIVSGEVPEILKKRLETFGIGHLFDSVKGGAWGHKEKSLAETLKKFGLKPKEAIYVDDTFDGITAAKNVGMAAIGWTKGYNSKRLVKKANPDFIADSMSKVKKIIKNGGR